MRATNKINLDIIRTDSNKSRHVVYKAFFSLIGNKTSNGLFKAVREKYKG